MSEFMLTISHLDVIPLLHSYMLGTSIRLSVLYLTNGIKDLCLLNVNLLKKQCLVDKTRKY